MNSKFLEEFIQISTIPTLVFGILLIAVISLLFTFRKKVSFQIRVLIATIVGILLGLAIQYVAGFPDNPQETTFVKETLDLYGLVGFGVVGLIRMLVIFLVVVSVIHVIINMKADAKLPKLVRNTIIVMTVTVAIAASLGVLYGMLFKLGKIDANIVEAATPREIQSLSTTFLNLIPTNPVAAMVNENIIGVVIFSIFVALGARRMNKKYEAEIKPFYDLINALYKIVTSVTMSVIKLIPYAVVALLARSIALYGISSILEAGKFVAVLYLALITMFIIQMIFLIINGISPIPYLKKSLEPIILAFSTRSSLGTLPVTLKTLTNKLGVNDSTGGFVGSLGTTAGMQGCAGIFPAMAVIYIANSSNTPISFTFIIMTIIVVTIGSVGIAGVPGTATIAASVSITGVGLGSNFSLISPIFAIDPILDMGRTALNVSGCMVNAIIIDKSLGQFDKDIYYSK